MKVYQEIAQAIRVIKGKGKMAEAWECYLDDIMENCLPRGSGIDNGNSINIERSNSERIVIESGYHCMNGNGYYCGWYEYTVIITPSLQFKFDMKIKGRNGSRDTIDVRDNLYDRYRFALSSDIGDETRLLLAQYL
jgi:hypothetical protein